MKKKDIWKNLRVRKDQTKGQIEDQKRKSGKIIGWQSASNIVSTVTKEIVKN